MIEERPSRWLRGSLPILAAILLFSGCGRKENKEDDVVFYLNEEPVRKAEYEMLAKKNSNQILRKLQYGRG